MMKLTKKIAISVFVVLISLLYSCEMEQEKVVDIESEKAAIQKVIDEHLDAVNLMDVDGVAAGITEDHIDMPPNMPRVIGKQGYIDYFTSYITFFNSMKDKKMDFNVDEFVVSGDWAFQIGNFHVKYTFQDDSFVEDKGNFVWIFKKEADGNWKWARVISNSTLPKPKQ